MSQWILTLRTEILGILETLVAPQIWTDRLVPVMTLEAEMIAQTVSTAIDHLVRQTASRKPGQFANNHQAMRGVIAVALAPPSIDTNLAPAEMTATEMIEDAVLLLIPTSIVTSLVMITAQLELLSTPFRILLNFPTKSASLSLANGGA